MEGVLAFAIGTALATAVLAGIAARAGFGRWVGAAALVGAGVGGGFAVQANRAGGYDGIGWAILAAWVGLLVAALLAGWIVAAVLARVSRPRPR